MEEIWLRTNQRAMGAFAAIVALAGAMLLAFAVLCFVAGGWVILGAITGVSACGLLIAALFVWKGRQTPRIARSRDDLTLYVADRGPTRVPLDVVEAFLLGTGPFPPNPASKHQNRTLIMKLSERAEDFRQRETRRAIAQWCGHYVTFQGAWCEPLSVDLVQSLNERLAAAKRELVAEVK